MVGQQVHINDGVVRIVGAGPAGPPGPPGPGGGGTIPEDVALRTGGNVFFGRQDRVLDLANLPLYTMADIMSGTAELTILALDKDASGRPLQGIVGGRVDFEEGFGEGSPTGIRETIAKAEWVYPFQDSSETEPKITLTQANWSEVQDTPEAEPVIVFETAIVIPDLKIMSIFTAQTSVRRQLPDPVFNEEPATKGYVDDAFSDLMGTGDALPTDLDTIYKLVTQFQTVRNNVGSLPLWEMLIPEVELRGYVHGGYAHLDLRFSIVDSLSSPGPNLPIGTITNEAILPTSGYVSFPVFTTQAGTIRNLVLVVDHTGEVTLTSSGILNFNADGTTVQVHGGDVRYRIDR